MNIDSEATKTAERGRASGGLIITYNRRIYNKFKVLNKSSNYIFIKVTINKKPLIIGVVYVNQTSDTASIFNELDNLLSLFNDKHQDQA